MTKTSGSFSHLVTRVILWLSLSCVTAGNTQPQLKGNLPALQGAPQADLARVYEIADVTLPEPRALGAPSTSRQHRRIIERMNAPSATKKTRRGKPATAQIADQQEHPGQQAFQHSSTRLVASDTCEYIELFPPPPLSPLLWYGRTAICLLNSSHENLEITSLEVEHLTNLGRLHRARVSKWAGCNIEQEK
jgi:hypothetical protein